jgi:hypothetical protein
MSYQQTALQDPLSFHDEARWQRVCAVCKKPTSGRFHAHHVVDKQTLRHLGITGNALYDTRNALRLCHGLTTSVRCHFRHENRVRVVKTTELTDDNIAYAFRVLGDAALDYLRREYDDTDPDPRIENMFAFRQRHGDT